MREDTDEYTHEDARFCLYSGRVDPVGVGHRGVWFLPQAYAYTYEDTNTGGLYAAGSHSQDHRSHCDIYTDGYGYTHDRCRHTNSYPTDGNPNGYSHRGSGLRGGANTYARSHAARGSGDEAHTASAADAHPRDTGAFAAAAG